MTELSTVLLVDDEEENLLVLSTLLEAEFRVLTARSVPEALEVLEAEAVDVLITDQRMPQTSGVELLKQSRALHPGVVRMALTAYTDVDLMLDAINEGSVYRYIIKPWTVEEMRTTIRQAVEWGRLCRDHGALAAVPGDHRELRARNEELRRRVLSETNRELRARNEELRRRNEELERIREQLLTREKLAAVGRFASEMAHEISNDLLVAKLLLFDVLESGPVEGTLGQLQLCDEQLEQVAQTARNVREFAAGVVPKMRFDPTDPRELVDSVVTMCRWHPDYRNVELSVESEEMEPWSLDRSKMMHLLANLVRNAMAMSPPGAPASKVVERLRKRDQSLLIEVMDRGPGVAPDQRQWIFEPFHSTKGSESSGLGLTICRWVAEAHGGTIDVVNEEGGGARFIVSLPYRAPSTEDGEGR